jgi:pimeloyl-ACP methyl ester carboxylesterase
VNRNNQKDKAEQLAGEVLAYRSFHPGEKICLAGYSEGCSVALLTAACLPPGSIDNIVLLSPTVPSTYDLRPALASVRCAIDVYFSEKDRLVAALDNFGPCDSPGDTFAALCGFRAILDTPQDRALYARLRQHPWCPEMAWTGHNGGHYGYTETDFLQAYVLPYLAADASRPAPK